MTNVVGVILAGGQGTRMGGQDKGLLSLGPHTILDEVIRRLAPQVDRLVLNVNGDPARFAHLALPTVPDSLGGFLGPLAGVLAGMEWARAHHADWVATVAADTPFFPLDFVVRCQDACQSGAPIALAATADADGVWHRQPTFGLWHVCTIDSLHRALESGLRKIVRWTDAEGGVEVRFETGVYDPFFNVNTPDELDDARRMLEQAQ